MEIGAPFNPYRVFQGAFAPFWLIEHRRLGAGAKLCYIRLLGFAGKDGHCYPSLETLGGSLGVSERQTRGYIRELEQAGLIAVEQRGLRRTNVYLFLWTAEFESLHTISRETLESESDESSSGPDRKDRSGQDRNSTTGHKTQGLQASHRRSCSGTATRISLLSDQKIPSAPDRNNTSGQERKLSSGPIGKSSEGNESMESSSSTVVSLHFSPEVVSLYNESAKGRKNVRFATCIGPERKWVIILGQYPGSFGAVRS